MVQYRRALRAIGRNEIIGARRCPHGSHRADGDYIWVIAGRGDRSVAMVIVRIVSAIVTGGYPYYDSRFPGLFHSLAQGVRGIAVEKAAAPRDMNDPEMLQTLRSAGLATGNVGSVGR